MCSVRKVSRSPGSSSLTDGLITRSPRHGLARALTLPPAGGYGRAAPANHVPRGDLAMSDLPTSASYVVVGAGIHGLSTGWHLGMELARRRRGAGQDVVVLDKTGVGAGASGIACGCVRNL